MVTMVAAWYIDAMSKTMLVGGYGVGISKAVAEKFGAEGFSLALAARSADKLEAGVKALQAKGIKAVGFPTDLSDPNAVRGLVEKARASLGPITIVQWTAYSGSAGDLLTADAVAIRNALDISVTGLVAAVQAALPDLKKEKNAAVLVTNGGLGFFDPKVDVMAVQYNAMGLAVANAAKHKLVGLLSAKLTGDGVYVGEVMVTGSVKGTAFDSGHATIEPSAVAAKFWELYNQRTTVTANVS
jgi:NADP-dependent 3-hydroxy acid dehydrogenase YdfG